MQMKNKFVKNQFLLKVTLTVLATLFTGLAIHSLKAPVELKEEIVTQTLQQNVAFNYAVIPKVSTLYPEPMPLNGQTTYFSQVTEQMKVHVNAIVTPEPEFAVEGTTKVLLTLQAGDYWEKVYVLDSEKQFTCEGKPITVLNNTFEIPLHNILAFTKQVEEETRVSPNGGYLLKVIPVITAKNRDNGEQLVNEFQPNISFQINQREIIPNGELTQKQSAAKTVASTSPGYVNILGLNILTITARYLFIPLAALTWGSAFWLFYEHRRKKPSPTEIQLINKRYKSRIITALNWSSDPGTSLIHLSSFKELLKLADALDKSIICVLDNGGKTGRYYLPEDNTLYFYEATETAFSPGKTLHDTVNLPVIYKEGVQS